MQIHMSINFSKFKPVNYLLPKFIERLGLEKSQHGIRQTIDLQRMHGNTKTFPVLIFETCGSGLVDVGVFRSQTGFICNEKGMVLIISLKQKSFQLLRDI